MGLNDLPVESGMREKICGMGHVTYGKLLTAVSDGTTMAEFANRMLAFYVDRAVIDRTGLTQRFDIRLTFADPRLAASTAGPTDPAESRLGVSVGSPLFEALQDQLGLKLAPAKAPQEVLVIDRVSRPSAN
jgi:uncharacterized protein (TIGR03435 family)